LLVRRECEVTRPGGAGVLWDDERQEWKYGKFVRDPDTEKIRFRPVPPTMIGGMSPDEEIEGRNFGIIRALLKKLT